MRMPRPVKNEFLDLVRTGTILPLSAEIDVPRLTPIAAFEALRAYCYPVLLESTRLDEKNGRYSFVTADPYLIFKSRGDDVELRLPTTPAGKYGQRASMKKKPLMKLRELMNNYRTCHVAGLPPFTGGAIGFFSYDFAYQLENLPRRAHVDLEIPESYIIFSDMVVAFDHVQNRVWVIVNPGAREQKLGFQYPAAERWSRLYDEAVLRLTSVMSKLETPGRRVIPVNPARKTVSLHPRLVPDLAQTEFASMIRRCKKYIADGDIRQANLSLRFSAMSSEWDPFLLYEILRDSNPSPYAVFLDFGDLQIVSSSSEHLVRLREGIVNSRLLTRWRSQDSNDREAIKQSGELQTNRAEHAGHNMLLEVQQSELDHICNSKGTVADKIILYKDHNPIIEIISDVHGTLEQRKDCLDLVRAVFPGGIVTGVPKVRCMEIIDELEPTARGPYAGSMGYISNSGNMDFNIGVSTFIFKGNVAYFQAGTTVTADCDSNRSYSEILQDAEIFKTAWKKPYRA